MNKRITTIISVPTVGVAFLLTPALGSAHSIPTCDRDYHVTIAMDTINPYPVWRDWSIVDTITGQAVKSGTTTFDAPGTSVSIDLPESIVDHPIEIYASLNYSHKIESLGAPVVCGKVPSPPSDVIVGPGPTPNPVVQPIKPTRRKPKPVVTCDFIRKHYSGQAKLNLLIKKGCYVRPKPNPRKVRTPGVTG